MRLWSLSPRYLDVKGLLAVWREGLLARAVLLGRTRGYKNHPQLDRFKAQPAPVTAINYYLEFIFDEARQRGYHFDSSKITCGLQPQKIAVTEGQVYFEMAHLQKKLQVRDPARLPLLQKNDLADLHPLFVLVTGGIEPWERA
jgi:predicted acyl esterase